MKVGMDFRMRYNAPAIAMAISLWGRTGFDGGDVWPRLQWSGDP